LPGSLTWGQGKPETKVVVADARTAPAANRRARAGGNEVPAAAASNAVGTGRRPLRIIPIAVPVIITTIPVLAPFPDITTHVMDAPDHWAAFVLRDASCYLTFPSYQATVFTSAPPANFSLFPPLRAAYSHSASVGRRYRLPLWLFKRRMKS